MQALYHSRTFMLYYDIMPNTVFSKHRTSKILHTLHPNQPSPEKRPTPKNNHNKSTPRMKSNDLQKIPNRPNPKLAESLKMTYFVRPKPPFFPRNPPKTLKTYPKKGARRKSKRTTKTPTPRRPQERPQKQDFHTKRCEKERTELKKENKNSPSSDP